MPDEKVWKMPVTVMIIARTEEEAFEMIADALHADPDVQMVAMCDGGEEVVEGTEELSRA